MNEQVKTAATLFHAPLSVERVLTKEMSAAKALRESIAAVIGDDADAMRDTIEGETGLHEAIASVMDKVRENELLIAGIDTIASALARRKSRLETAIERQRAAVEQAMLIAELRALELPDALLTIKETPAKIIITDESKVPASFWQAQEPKINKTAINAAIRAGEAIDGVTLGNKTLVLQVRRS